VVEIQFGYRVDVGSMHNLIEIQQQLLPDLLHILRRRYLILHQLRSVDTIGRRTLATSLAMTERVLRTEIEFLRTQGLLHIDSLGMSITDSGLRLLTDMEPFYKQMFGLSELEERVRSRYGLRQVIVVSGDVDHSMHTKQELGRAGCVALRNYMERDDVVAVTGGSTIAEVANQLTTQTPLKGNLFVPARGGLGESLEYQANTIASTMAKRTGAQYRLLHVPDHLGEEAYTTLMQEPNVQEIVDVVRSARIVLHGIGDAILMANRRRVDEATIAELCAEGAHAEAFGYYFDRQGKVVHRTPTIGLRLEDIAKTQVVIAIAGGGSKAEAIAAIMKSGHDDVLVTDEAAATEMLRLAGETW
jgi:central glycolytic genes regulator